MGFLENLEYMMKQKGLNKTQLAELTGISKNTIYSWWNQGYDGISLTRLRLLCDCLGCTMDFLVFGVDNWQGDAMTTTSVEECRLLAAYRRADDAMKAVFDSTADAVLKRDATEKKANPA